MARAKKCEEEFNPWPPFVDVFSSVILVLLLLILVFIVNIAYYMQFNSKVNSTATTKSVTNNLEKGQDPTELVTIKKNIIQVESKTSNQSMFKGGKSEGNAISSDTKDKEYTQDAKATKGELIISYSGKELFVTGPTKSKVKSFASKHKSSTLTLEVANPTNIISSTLRKQISIGRMITIKNIIKKSGINLSQVKINIKNIKDPKYPYGYVKVIAK